ncbi:MAG: hypothetical protein COY39_06000 [Alphaproteobacteria bacterium CG_4_10_14_0_8_um_filter_37_21]|nr:MAG: hypothetical protein COY39_06000 [Alphaproteobacteria bacterium CG_4_10_14_0_8_um_filter_37_21]
MDKKILRIVKNFFIKLKDMLYQEEEYFLVQLTPQTLSFQHMKGKRIVTSSHAELSCMQKILKQLNVCDIPIQLVLKNWDLKVRQLNLNNMNFFDRPQAKKNFITGEFSAQDTVFCKKAYATKNIYTMIGLQHNFQLDQALNSLASLNNAIKKVQLFETEILKKIAQNRDQKSTEENKLFALLTESNKRWQLLIGHNRDLIYSRFLEQTPSKHYQNDLIQDVIDTLNYLPRLGFHNNAPLMLFSKKGLFKNDAQLQKSIIQLIPVTNMNNFLSLDNVKQTTLATTFSWFSDSVSIPIFFWNRLSYTLPKLSVLILLPVLLILGIAATYLSIHTAIYLKKVESIEKKSQNFLSLNPDMNTYLQKFKYFDFFKKHYQKSPILMLKNIKKLTGPFMNLQAIHWMKRENSFVLDCTFICKQNISQKSFHTMQKKIVNRSPQKIQHLAFYPSDAQGTKVVSLNVSGAE